MPKYWSRGEALSRSAGTSCDATGRNAASCAAANLAGQQADAAVCREVAHLAAALWAGADAVYYAADRDDAARAGFDDRQFYELFAAPRHTWPVAVAQVAHVDAGAPFTAWGRRGDRVDY